MKRVLALAVAMTLVAGVAQAATETFNFSGYSEKSKEKTFVGDYGSKVVVTAGNYHEYIKDGVHTAGTKKIGQWDGGLGVKSYKKDEHYVDGDKPEFLKFSFGEHMVLHSIKFSNYGNGEFDWYSSNGNGDIDVSMGADVSGTKIGSMFFLGAYGKQGFKVKSITVKHKKTPPPNEIPLPAAGFLLLGGLGGLVALRKKK